jgi:AcrR family transcriptional regulator
VVALTSARALRTRARIVDVALDLFERNGYEVTTTAQIAADAGVTPMTFFRHFPTKAAVVVSDPYDPLIADAVAAQPAGLTPLERTRRGMLVAHPETPSTYGRFVASVGSGNPDDRRQPPAGYRASHAPAPRGWPGR